MPPLLLSQSEKHAIHQLLERFFPNLTLDNYEIWSECTDEYNCIAYAGNMGCKKPWWPADPRYSARDYYWPECMPFVDSVENFIRAFQLFGYETCSGPEYEDGFEKVAIYEDQTTKETRHMARQLSNGIWTSKLGDWWDIQHQTLEAVESSHYGVVVQIMKRPRKGLE